MKKEILKGIVLMMVGAMTLGGMKVDGVKIPANARTTSNARNSASEAESILGPEGEIPADELRMYEQRAIELAEEIVDGAAERSEAFHRTGAYEDPDVIHPERIDRDVLEGNPVAEQRLRRAERLRNMSQDERRTELLNLRTAMNMVRSNLHVRTMGRKLHRILNRQILRSVDIFVQVVAQRLTTDDSITTTDISISLSRRLYTEIVEVINTEKDRLSNYLNGRLSEELLDNIAEVYLNELVDRLSQKLISVVVQLQQ